MTYSVAGVPSLGGFGAQASPKLVASAASKLTMVRLNPDSARGPDYFSCVKAYPEKPPSYCKGIYPLPGEEGGTSADPQNGDKKENGNGKENGEENGEGLSTTAKVGIAVGVAALLGTGFYFYKKRSAGTQ